ncbi:hypothetical protein AUJ84_02575 [Candidatus Pacearchaeota archaeon CG1_02_32_132]|nr:MAG: hypothetical protein AUJ84_02575 [Candidatus Pacearchaeota archaeon CG1_02_32_132]
MNTRQIWTMLAIFTLFFSGITLGKDLSTSIKNPVSDVSPPSITATPITGLSSDSYEDSPSTIIKMISNGIKIDDKILLENNIIPTIPNQEKSTSNKKSVFTGKIEIYDQDNLISTSTYIKGFKLDSMSLNTEEIIEEMSEGVINDCKILSEPGIYVLNSTVYSESTCFEITSNKVLLDCNHHSIIFATSSPGSAVTSSGNDLLAIKNCGIVQLNQPENLPAINIENGKNIAIMNNAIKSSSSGINIVSLTDTNFVSLIGNSIESSRDDTNTISIINSKNINMKNNGLSTSGDRSTVIYLNSVTKSSIVNNRISTSGFMSPAIYLSTSGKNELSDNKIKNTGDDSPAFVIYGQSIDNAFKSNHIVQASDAFEFDAGLESGTIMQNGNKLISNKIGGITGQTLNLLHSSPESNITLISQGVRKYSLPENGLYAVIKRDAGEIRFIEPITGTGNSGIEAVNISLNHIEIKSSIAPGLDRKAIILFKNINETFNNPVIIKNDNLCIECELLTPINQSAVAVRIPGAGTYKIGERPQQIPENIPQEIIPLKNGGHSSGSSCTTGWSCEDWTPCSLDESGQGIRTRTCSPEISYCYANLKDKPAESESCTIENNANTQENQPGFISRITGAVIGFGRDAPVLATVIFLGLVGGMYLLVAFARTRFVSKKRK